jgi:4-amino-4-deoxy-L-arabinose transferase-like glycosyltransferase
MPRDRTRLKAGLLLASAMGFALLGQFYFFERRAYYWDGIIFTGIALICFVWLIALATRPTGIPSDTHTINWRARTSRALDDRRTIGVLSALFLNLIAARSADTRSLSGHYTLSATLWLASLVIFFATFVSVPRLLRRSPVQVRRAFDAIRHDRRYTTELALVLGLILIGLLLRMWDLEHIPANLSGDEGTQGMWALDAAEGRLRNPFSTGWFSVPTMSFFVQSVSLRVFGDTVAGLRSISALIGTATLLFTYLFARRNLGRRVALFALAVLTFNHYHIHFSRLGSNQVADPFFMVLTLWLLSEGLRRTRSQTHSCSDTLGHGRNTQAWFLAAGLTVGLSWYGYFGSRVIVLVIIAYVFIQAVLEKGFLRRTSRPLIIMTIMAFLAASPLLLHYLNSPANLTARFSQVNFFRWLDNELARPGHDSVFNLVVRQIWRSISAFNYTLDPTFWYRAEIPLLDFISGLLFLLGLVTAAIQWRRSVMRWILLWFGFAVTIGWILTENPPSSMRMVIIAPAVALLAAIGLDRLLVLAQWTLGGGRQSWNWVGLTLLAFAAFLNVQYYFFIYTPTRVYGNPSAETATVLARHLRARAAASATLSPSDTQKPENSGPFVYLYGPPYLYYDFGTIQFIARDVPGVNVSPREEDPGFLSRVSGTALFVVLSERLDELAAILAQYPDGQLREFYSGTDGRLMFVSYEVP